MGRRARLQLWRRRGPMSALQRDRRRYGTAHVERLQNRIRQEGLAPLAIAAGNDGLTIQSRCRVVVSSSRSARSRTAATEAADATLLPDIRIRINGQIKLYNGIASICSPRLTSKQWLCF